MNKKGWLVRTYGEEKMKEAEKARARLEAYRDKIQPYPSLSEEEYKEPSPEVKYIISTDPATRKLAEEARVIAGGVREEFQEHVSHTDKKKKDVTYT
jgi:hypothetical protein